MQILSPKRRVDILRDVMAAKERGQPYIVTFCGVNGVGKSTNLAKVCMYVCMVYTVVSTYTCILCVCIMHAIVGGMFCSTHDF